MRNGDDDEGNGGDDDDDGRANVERYRCGQFRYQVSKDSAKKINDESVC